MLLVIMTVSLFSVVSASLISSGGRIIAGSIVHARSTPPVALAKKGGKKGGGKKKGSPKKSGFEWASTFESKPFENATMRELAEVLASTHRTRTGRSLHASLDMSTDVPKSVWSAPIAALVVAAADDGGGLSTCRYANLAACEALGFPSKDGYKSVIDCPIELASSCGADKYESGYTKRLACPGAASDEPRVIRLEDAQRWVLEKAAIVDGKLVSQPIGFAYAFEEWVEEADGFVCRPGGVRSAPQMSAEELEAAIAAQGAEVRRLKEVEGLANADSEVKEAVAELLRLKAMQDAK